MADFDNFDAIGLSGETDPLFWRRYGQGGRLFRRRSGFLLARVD